MPSRSGSSCRRTASPACGRGAPTRCSARSSAGDIDEALDAAARIGDDTLQRQSQGRVVPDSFTHGTSEQRQAWFYQGFEQGSLESCDTFSIDRV
ncbi:MAG: neutral zinc metallopeptidase [Geminicoccaceae bacterium]